MAFQIRRSGPVKFTWMVWASNRSRGSRSRCGWRLRVALSDMTHWGVQCQIDQIRNDILNRVLWYIILNRYINILLKNRTIYFVYIVCHGSGSELFQVPTCIRCTASQQFWEEWFMLSERSSAQPSTLGSKLIWIKNTCPQLGFIFLDYRCSSKVASQSAQVGWSFNIKRLQWCRIGMFLECLDTATSNLTFFYPSPGVFFSRFFGPFFGSVSGDVFRHVATGLRCGGATSSFRFPTCFWGCFA